MPRQQVRLHLPFLCMRPRRYLRPGHHGHRRVHLSDRVHAVGGWRCVQRVRLWLLPQQWPVCGLPRRLYHLHLDHHMPAMLIGPFAPAWWHVLRCRLSKRLLLQWDRVQCLPGHLRDMHVRSRMRHLHGRVGDAFTERNQLRRDVPCGNLPVRHSVPRVQQQLCGLHDHGDHVHSLPRWPGAQHPDQHLCGILPDRLYRC